MVTKVAFCDGGAYPVSDGHVVAFIKYAAWCAWDYRFEVREVLLDLPKKNLIVAAETRAIELALQFNPDRVCSDNKQISERWKGGVPIEWVPRKKNRIADALTRSPVGLGYIVFNSPQPERGWVDFIYD